MPSVLRIILGTIVLICVCVGNGQNTHASSKGNVYRVEHLNASQMRSKRFIDGIVNEFLDKLQEAFLEYAGEAKEKFVREMYIAIKNFANEGKDEFIKKIKIAVNELPGMFSSFLSKLVPTVVNYIWSDDGNSPGFQRLRQMVYKQADQMGITGGASYQYPGLLTSLVLMLISQFWRIIAS